MLVGNAGMDAAAGAEAHGQSFNVPDGGGRLPIHPPLPLCAVSCSLHCSHSPCWLALLPHMARTGTLSYAHVCMQLVQNHACGISCHILVSLLLPSS